MSIGKEKSDQRKHAAQKQRLAFNSRGKGPDGLVNARICPREKHNEQQKIVADAGTGHVGGALERLDYGWPSGAVLAAIRACAVTGVADPVETGQRHQTVSQGDTTTPGFIPSQSRLWSRPAPCPLGSCAKTLDLLGFGRAETESKLSEPRPEMGSEGFSQTKCFGPPKPGSWLEVGLLRSACSRFLT